MKIKGILVLLVLLVLSSCRSVVAPEFDLDPIVKEEKSKNLKYIEVKEESDLVIKAKVIDKLTLANSVVKDKNNFYSLRTLEILSIFKDSTELELKEEDEITIQEAAAMDVNNVYYTSNHMPLVEDHEYVLFLKLNDDDQLEIVDGDNGVVNVNNIVNNQNIETTVNVIFEHFEPSINGVQIKYVPLTMVNRPKNVKFERVTIKTDQLELTVRTGQDVNTKKEYLAIGTMFFEFESSILTDIKNSIE